MSVPYKNSGPIDTSIEPNLAALKEKNVIVTGGSSGLGAAYVVAFLKAGAHVTNADIQKPIDYNPQSDTHYQFIQTDVTKFNDQVAMFKAALKHSPTNRIDIVIANAGISGSDPIFTLNPDVQDPDEPDLKILQIDLIGMMYTAKCAMHYWQFDSRPAEEKCFIIKSSLAGYVDLPAATSYQVAKFGVRGMMVNLRVADRCRVNLIAPWFIRTSVMSSTVADVITERLHAVGSDWADIQDSVRAVLRVATDNAINGRALAIVPKSEVKEGYMDIDRDDYPEGTSMAKWQGLSVKFTHRTLPKDQQ